MNATASTAKQSDVSPACGVAKQCSEKQFREVSREKIAGFFDPCGNPECFGESEPEPGEIVVVARGRGTEKMHACRENAPAASVGER